MELVHSFYEALSQVQLKLFFVRFPFISWQILPLEHLGRRKVGGWSAPEQWVRVDRARLARPLRVREGVVVTILDTKHSNKEWKGNKEEDMRKEGRGGCSDWILLQVRSKNLLKKSIETNLNYFHL